MILCVNLALIIIAFMMEMEDPLAKAGLYVDELYKLRILDPEVSQQTSKLKEECGEFLEKINEFKVIVDGFINMVTGLSKAVEEEKIKAIGSRNLLKSMSKQREAEQQQLQALIGEKKTGLERLHIEHDSMIKVQTEQERMIDEFVSQK